MDRSAPLLGKRTPADECNFQQANGTGADSEPSTSPRWPDRIRTPRPSMDQSRSEDDWTEDADPTDGDDEDLENPSDVTIQRLITEVPENVIGWLQKFGIQKLGEIQVSSAIALEFRLHEDIFLTQGMSDTDSVDFTPETPGRWRAMWHRVLSSRIPKSKPRATLLNSRTASKRILQGWESRHTLEASVLILKHACDVGSSGLLNPIVRRAWAGAADISVFEVKAIRAVTSFKWHTYAKWFVYFQLLTYMGWVVGFTGFSLVLNNNHMGEDGCPAILPPSMAGLEPWLPCLRQIGIILLALSTLASIPFLIIEICTFYVYGPRITITHMSGAIDSIVLIKQYVIVFMLAMSGKADPFHAWEHSFIDFDLLVAIQLVLLWTRLSQFFRGFKIGDYEPIDMLKTVLWEARTMLGFMSLLMLGFAFAYTTLYRTEYDDEDFSGIGHSFVTLLIIGAGQGVNIHGMYVSRHGGAPVYFFLIFDIMFSIILLNIFLAVVVSIFDQIRMQGKALHLRRRAELIDEIDTLLGLFGIHNDKWTPTYLHILEMKQRQSDGPADAALQRMLPFQLYKCQRANMQSSHLELMQRLEELERIVNSSKDGQDSSQGPPRATFGTTAHQPADSSGWAANDSHGNRPAGISTETAQTPTESVVVPADLFRSSDSFVLSRRPCASIGTHHSDTLDEADEAMHRLARMATFSATRNLGPHDPLENVGE